MTNLEEFFVVSVVCLTLFLVFLALGNAVAQARLGGLQM